ncbi:alpha/beta hydrolase [Lacticaseibacillus casei]|uniref:patatin-like phospholipase family protein n=1 Tax=Lacticaseibacillus zeae TaxID=57037 RepID=UPI0005C76F32|nr:patatin-like phospholipase family protein [Lacticaseibacillus zeae]OLS07927.1 alpha/beta hydrolase [Lacticaseibacillus casei]QVI33472.1 patatin-like phospholipase family protein [Lacticaseibacillus zeae]
MCKRRCVSLTLAVVFGGGAAHGAYQAGVWTVLGPQLAPTFVIGSSIGAINAAATARMTPFQLARWWQYFTARKMTGPVFARRNFVPLLDQMLKMPKRDDRAVLVVTTSLPDFKAHVTRLDVLDAVDAREWLLASSAMPGVFTPIKRQGVNFVDGGVVNDLPVDLARDIGADFVVAISGEGIGRIGHDHGDCYLKPSHRLPQLFDFRPTAIAAMLEMGRQDAENALRRMTFLLPHQ